MRINETLARAYGHVPRELGIPTKPVSDLHRWMRRVDIIGLAAALILISLAVHW